MAVDTLLRQSTDGRRLADRRHAISDTIVQSFLWATTFTAENLITGSLDEDDVAMGGYHIGVHRPSGSGWRWARGRPATGGGLHGCDHAPFRRPQMRRHRSPTWSVPHGAVFGAAPGDDRRRMPIPERLATGLMAALQGGLLLARTTRDVRRLEVALMVLSTTRYATSSEIDGAGEPADGVAADSQLARGRAQRPACSDQVVHGGVPAACSLGQPSCPR
jgi:hypothetical protein